MKGMMYETEAMIIKMRDQHIKLDKPTMPYTII